MDTNDLIRGFKNSIDNEPWLSMLAWADTLAESASEDDFYTSNYIRALRWMVARKRFPRQQMTPDGPKYYWLWQSGVSSSYYPYKPAPVWQKMREGSSSHILPLFSTKSSIRGMAIERNRKFDTPSQAIAYAVPELLYFMNRIESQEKRISEM